MKRAFTLIELLVVIAIIALLSSIVLVSLNASRAKARDAQRVSHLREIQKALELYANENGGTYPNTYGSWKSVCNGSPSQFVVYDGSLMKGIVPSDISQFPADPEMACSGSGALDMSQKCVYAYQGSNTDYKVRDWNCPTAGTSNTALSSLEDPVAPTMWAVYTPGAANWP